MNALAADRPAPAAAPTQPRETPAGAAQGGAATPQAQPSTPARPAAARPEPVQRLLGPDLVVTGFSLVPGKWLTEGVFATSPFWVTVKNAGMVQVDKPFHVSLQHSSAGSPAWQGENDGNNCWKVTALPLKPNQTYRFQARLKVLGSAVSDRTLKLRALVDYECFTDIPAPNGAIAETNEGNNFSNELSVSAGYLPSLTSVSPSVCPRGEECSANGPSLGSQQGDHALVVEQGGRKTAVTVKSWANAQVRFVVPETVGLGEAQIYVAAAGTLNKLSNALTFTVAETKAVRWADLLTMWEALKGGFELTLDNWSGGSAPENVSTLVALGETVPIDVPLVEKSNWAGHYRFMLDDMRSASHGITLSKEGCQPNQLRLIVAFEDEGKEVIGYYKVLGPAGEWRREGAPDIQIDDATLGILFNLTSKDGALDYSVHASFSANVHANNKAADDIMDYFMGGWDGDIKAKLISSVNSGLARPTVKAKIVESLMKLIRQQAGVSGQTIRKMEFTGEALMVTWY